MDETNSCIETKQETNYTINVFRIVASILVVYVHVFENNLTLFHEFPYIFYISKLALPFFAGVSGFFYYSKDSNRMLEKSIKNIRSVLKILLPAWLVLNLIHFVINVAQGQNPLSELYSMVKLNPKFMWFSYGTNEILWYMFCLVIIYMIMIVLTKLNQLKLVYFFIGLGFVIEIMNTVFEGEYDGIPKLFSFFFPAFAAGMLVKYTTQKNDLQIKKIKIASPIILVILVLVHFYINEIFFNPELMAPFIIYFALIIMIQHPNVGKGTKIPMFGKVYAKNLYIAHKCFIGVFLINFTQNVWLLWSITVVSILILSVLYQKSKPLWVPTIKAVFFNQEKEQDEKSL